MIVARKDGPVPVAESAFLPRLPILPARSQTDAQSFGVAVTRLSGALRSRCPKGKVTAAYRFRLAMPEWAIQDSDV